MIAPAFVVGVIAGFVVAVIVYELIRWIEETSPTGDEE